MSKYNYNQNFFEKIDTEEKAYWLGFLYADGCITRFYRNEKLKSMSLELTLKADDVGHIFKFLNDLDSNVPIQDKKNKINDKVYYAKRVVINCTKMCRDLIEAGCTPEKSLTLTFPSSEIVEHNLINHFIRGYFDGDGMVHFSKSNVFHKNKNKSYLQNHYSASFIGTPEFLSVLKKELESNNIKCSKIYSGNCGKALEFRIYGFDNLKNFYSYIYNKSSVQLKRKKNVFEKAFKEFCPSK